MKSTNRDREVHGDGKPTGTRRLGIRRYSAVELLIALVALFAFSPFVQELQYGQGVEAMLMTIVLLSALFAVAGPRRTLLGTVLVVPALVARWLHHFRPDLFPKTVFFIAALCFMVFVIAHLLHFVLRVVRVNAEVLCASIAAYLMLGLLWAMAYEVVAQNNPGAFAFGAPGQTLEGFTAFYFSFVTLSTVGFGDITPASRGARMLAVMEAVTGMFYIAVLVARLVALYSTPASPPGSTPPRDL